ncbi:MAG TPA: ParB/RepB/Spo0J family partition protein [Micromonosporaceae bacterium]|nr:ParB/RepB/Spo0J family partition protein [Micromonosporaceae bacterium]
MFTLEEIDPRQLVPNERNPQGRATRSIDDLLASIPVVGILQPLVVIAVGDDTYRIDIGHRRYRAALELGLDTVPCLVAQDEGVAMQLAGMLAENTHREDFTATEQGEMYAQLTLLDWDAERIAEFTTRPVEHVRAAITLTRMPAAAQSAADAGDLTLDDAAALAAFSTDPKTVEKVLQRGTKGWGLKHVIAEEQHKIQAKDAMERCKAELIVAGVKVIKTPKGWPYGEQQMVLAKDLADRHGNPLDPDEVKTKPGFAAIVTRAYGAQPPTVEIVCTDPDAWGYAPVAGTSEHARAERDAAKAAKEAFIDAFAAATQIRWQFLTQTYATAKTAKTLYLTALRAAVTDPDRIKYPTTKLHDLATKLAGTTIDPDVAAGAGIDRLTRMLVARWVCASEDNLVRLATNATWGVDPHAGVEYLDVLVQAGYDLSDAETALRTDLVNTINADADADADAADDEAEGPGDEVQDDDPVQGHDQGQDDEDDEGRDDQGRDDGGEDDDSTAALEPAEERPGDDIAESPHQVEHPELVAA